MRLNKLSHKSINSWLLLAALFAPILYLFGALFTTQLGAHGSMNLAQGEEQFVPSSSYEESLDGSFGVNPYNADYVYNASSFVPSNVFGNSVVIDGSLVDSLPTGFLSVGFNQWDELWEIGGIDTQGKNVVYNQGIRSVGYMRLFSDVDYFVHLPSLPGLGMAINFYDSNFVFLGSVGKNVSGTFTPVVGSYYFRINFNAVYGTTYNNDVCINISNPALNGVYKPFVSYDYSIPFLVLRSAGNVVDNLDYVNVGSYTFTGDEVWTAFGSGYQTTIGVASKVVSNSVVPNVVSDTGLSITYRDSIYSGGTGISLSGTTIYVSSTNGLVGKVINYELATPVSQSSISIPDSLALFEGGSVYLKSNLVNSFQGKYFMYEGDYVLTPSSFSDYLFGQFFAHDNFLAESGRNVIEGIQNYGFQPMGELIRFTDANMLHLANLEYGYLMIGYAYYAIHVIFLDLVVYLTLFIPRLIRGLVDRLEGGVDL